MLRIIGLLWILAFGLTACAGGAEPAISTPTLTSAPSVAASPTSADPSPSTSTPSIPGTVTLWLDWNPDEMRALESLIEDYRDLHPGASFQIIYYPTDQLHAALETEPPQDEAPSLIFAPSAWGADLMEDGWIRDISHVIRPEQRQALHPFALSQVERSSAVIGLPLELHGTVLYRNRALAEEPATTVANMVQLSQQARLEAGQGSSFDLGYRIAAPMVSTCNGVIDPDPSVVPISQPAGLCWLRLLDRLGKAGPAVFDSDEDLELFLQGETMWLMESTSRMVQLQQALGEELLAVDSWPLYEPTGEPLEGAVWTENAYFPTWSSDQDFEAAWSFATFMLAPENQRFLSQARGVKHLPALTSVDLQEDAMQQAMRVLNAGVPLTSVLEDDRIRRELSTAIRLVVADGGDPELALGLALEEIRRARIPTPTPTRTPSPTLTPTPTDTPVPTPPPG
ncbi:MAG: extracellular solute-binding protein [Anaerolineales bacterium]